MTRLPWSASVLQIVGSSTIEELPLVDADDLGVRHHRSSSSRELFTTAEAIRISLCDTM